MDRVFSARLDEVAIEEMSRVARRLGMTKKEFLESAIRLRVRELDAASEADVWEQTFGAWTRDETVEKTRIRARTAFERGLRRHHGRRARST